MARPTRTDSTDPAQGVEVRSMGYGDLPAVISIERRSFSSPWSLAMFVLELSKPTGVCLVAVAGGSPIGYVVCSRFDRAWHLMNIAVAPARRRRGAAAAMIEAVLSEIGDADPVTLEVRPSNHAAIAMYERFGFRSNGIRRRYYSDNGEDAVIMWLGDPRAAGVPA